MASPMDSAPSFMNPMVTDEEFKTFHTIDRSLYSRLVINIARDPAEAMLIMALWIWLEREDHADDLVYNMLSLPDNLIKLLADETVLCLNCAESERFRLSTDTIYIPLIHSVTKTRLNLRFFYDNRLAIIGAVTKIVNEVCARAFEDISFRVLKNKRVAPEAASKAQNMGQETKPPNAYGPAANDHPGAPVMYRDVPTSIGVFGQQMGISVPPHQYVMGSNTNDGRHSGVLQPFGGAYDHVIQRQAEIADAFSHIKITAAEEDRMVPEHDRTIFLTFSKGYPISEEEVRAFFTGRNGDCIEAIFMEDVSAEEQPLYARLVVHTPAIIQAILEGKSKAKFTINGKHVWARKFVPKNPKSSSSLLNPSSPQPTSPVSP